MKRAIPPAIALLVLLVVPNVAAHAEAYLSSPGRAERLPDSPTEVVVSFTEPIYHEGSWIQVWDLSGVRWDNDDLEITPGQQPIMKVTVPELPEGPYLIKWQTYSQTDGHTIRHAIGFSVGGFAPPEPTSRTDDVPVAAGFARAVLYTGYSISFGALMFGFTVLRNQVSPPRRLLLDVLTVSGAGIHLAGLFGLLADTAASSGIPLTAFLSSSGGEDLLIRIATAAGLFGLSALWLFGPVRPRWSEPLLILGWITAIALGARFGHAGTASGWLVQTIHGAAIAAWTGGLLVLFIFLSFPKYYKIDWKGARKLGVDFGTMAIIAVTAVALTGFALSLTVLGTDLFAPGRLYDGNWRRFLLLKISLVIVMIMLAAINRRIFLTRPKEVGNLRQRIRGFAANRLHWYPITNRKQGTRDFRNVVAVEAIFAAVVLFLAGFLMSVAAPAEGLESQAATLEASGEGDEYTALLQITPEPAASQFSTVRIYIEDFRAEPLVGNSCIGGGELRNDCITMTWWPVGENKSSAQDTIGIPDGHGWWAFERVLWSTHGNHTINLDISSEYVYLDRIEMQVHVLRSEPELQ